MPELPEAETIVRTLRPFLEGRAITVAEFLSKMQVPNDEISTVLAWGDDNGATPEEVAVHFLKDYEAIWTTWVPAEVAEKVKASL